GSQSASSDAAARGATRAGGPSGCDRSEADVSRVRRRAGGMAGRVEGIARRGSLLVVGPTVVVEVEPELHARDVDDRLALPRRGEEADHGALAGDHGLADGDRAGQVDDAFVERSILDGERDLRAA